MANGLLAIGLWLRHGELAKIGEPDGYEVMAITDSGRVVSTRGLGRYRIS